MMRRTPTRAGFTALRKIGVIFAKVSKNNVTFCCYSQQKSDFSKRITVKGDSDATTHGTREKVAPVDSQNVGEIQKVPHRKDTGLGGTDDRHRKAPAGVKRELP